MQRFATDISDPLQNITNYCVMNQFDLFQEFKNSLCKESPWYNLVPEMINGELLCIHSSNRNLHPPSEIEYVLNSKKDRNRPSTPFWEILLSLEWSTNVAESSFHYSPFDYAIML